METINSNWVKQTNNNTTQWKRFNLNNNNIIAEEISDTDPYQENETEIDTNLRKKQAIKEGDVIYTKWKYNNHNWQRFIIYPWNEINEEISELVPKECVSIENSKNKSIIVNQNDNSISHEYDNSKNNTINKISEKDISSIINKNNDIQEQWMDRNDGTPHWIRYLSNNNVIKRERIDTMPKEEEINESEEDKKNTAINNNTVVYSSWSKRFDNHGEYWRRYISWPWGEVERELVRENPN